MAETVFRAWWSRLRGKLAPVPCPYSQAGWLDMPLRKLRAGPKKILGWLGLKPGERVLEIGPGVGYYSVEAARRVGRAGHLVCLDIQREMLQRTQRRLREGAAAPFALIQGDALRLPLRSGVVDRVVLITVLGELPARTQALDEIRRVLRPGGRLSVSEQLPDPDFVTLRSLRRELSAHGFVEEASRGYLVYASTWRRAGPAVS
jgi:ubiquinone/menaquinone biosynthesis C-methylase UbiE